ncbi:myb/SANT-like DNA-binding domain-containing protein 3 isoform 3-T4 [Trichechus inunguis]
MQNNEIVKPAKYFSELEKSILLALVEKYKYVLECKKSDARTIALKQRTWQALAHEYNSQPSVSLRDFKQLKKCWENIKARTKKIMAHERREKVKRSVSPLLSTHVLGKEKIANMLPEQLYFLQSPPEEEPEYHPDAAAQVCFQEQKRRLELSISPSGSLWEKGWKPAIEFMALNISCVF